MDNVVANNIVLDPLSFRDRNGRLFRFNGQIYRGIFEYNASLYRRLFEEKIIQKIMTKNLIIETEISDLKLDDYSLILKHRTIPFITYPHEWCSDMFKDATLLHIDLTLELGKYNLTIYDANPLNILFDWSRPIFVDFCSIVSAEDDFYWPGEASKKFYLSFIHFLSLMQHQYVNTARTLLMHSYGARTYIVKEQLDAFYAYSVNANKWKIYTRKIIDLTRHYIPLNVFKLAKNIVKSKTNKNQTQKSSLSFLRKLKREVEQIQIPRFKINSLISYDDFFASLDPSPEWTTKQKSVHKILSELKPKSVLDIDSDQGWYAQLAAGCGSQVVAFDNDEACVQKLYNDAKENNLSILPLAIDWTARDAYLNSEFITSPDQRLQCDLVMCLTIVHHLIFQRKLGFDKMFNQLFKFCKRWLLIEFIPYSELKEVIPVNNKKAMEWWEENSWYTLEEFIDVLKSEFAEVHVFPSYPDSRCLLLCDKLAN
ncbi:hypothetical protein [Coleofasciculus sp. F4-SAH-05]|uniref:hypothetical protein n=1 Tax=Coleofasciculus sp. F4-SAH-05 TaxID=3069525 RepID=UPI003300CC13